MLGVGLSTSALLLLLASNVAYGQDQQECIDEVFKECREKEDGWGCLLTCADDDCTYGWKTYVSDDDALGAFCDTLFWASWQTGNSVMWQCNDYSGDPKNPWPEWNAWPIPVKQGTFWGSELVFDMFEDHYCTGPNADFTIYPGDDFDSGWFAFEDVKYIKSVRWAGDVRSTSPLTERVNDELPMNRPLTHTLFHKPVLSSFPKHSQRGP